VRRRIVSLGVWSGARWMGWEPRAMRRFVRRGYDRTRISRRSRWLIPIGLGAQLQRGAGWADAGRRKDRPAFSGTAAAVVAMVAVGAALAVPLASSSGCRHVRVTAAADGCTLPAAPDGRLVAIPPRPASGPSP
jgi:hypothetical protein